MNDHPPIERCKCGGSAVAELLEADRRWHVRCESCGAVDMPSHFQHVSIDMWNESQLMHRYAAEFAAGLAKSGEGAGDKLREDAP